jgi:hypothetical protein
MPVAMWVVWSNEHLAYWGPHERGYTRRIEAAGRYTRDQARAICFPGRGRAGSPPDGDGSWPPPEMMFPDPQPVAPMLDVDMHAHFGKQLK